MQQQQKRSSPGRRSLAAHRTTAANDGHAAIPRTGLGLSLWPCHARPGWITSGQTIQRCLTSSRCHANTRLTQALGPTLGTRSGRRVRAAGGAPSNPSTRENRMRRMHGHGADDEAVPSRCSCQGAPSREMLCNHRGTWSPKPRANGEGS